METLESSRVCRLCGQHSGICINIFDKTENHVKKINAVLPILVHEMDMLPKQMCHRCSYKLEEFHKFYADCLKTDMNLKSQLSWMRKREVEDDIRVPMVQIENVKIKSEPPDYDIYELDPIVDNVNYIRSMSSLTYSMNNVKNNNVNSTRISDLDRRYTCNNTFANCAHCKFDYGKSTSTNRTALSNDQASRLKCNAKKDCSSSSVANTLENGQKNDTSKYMRRLKHGLSKEIHALGIGNILGTDQVKEIKIKTEKPDMMEVRSLRPRNKSVDYLGTKRKKENLIVNPANRSVSAYIKQRMSTKQIPDSEIGNKIVLSQIKTEPLEEIPSRTLRPRKSGTDRLDCKRKDGRPGANEVCTKKRKSLNDFKESSRFGSGKRFSGFISSNIDFKVKEEILSYEETANVEQENDTNFSNEIPESCVRNLSSLFDRQNNQPIKVEENIENRYSDRLQQSTSSSLSKCMQKLTSNKLLRRNVAVKRTSGINYSPKHLRSQDLRLRNGKVKNPASNRFSVSSLKKRLIQLNMTKGALGSNPPSKIKENLNTTKISASLKTADNIKKFCEKCCNSFLNKELYELHRRDCGRSIKHHFE
ncbi:uncharacterized protein LOC107226808 [Neodiprion lecontei]|uniref:Uncharacterized protein LOC107226808 n=1 Tax=Neodiprion lecontei TaxID=441921 RepID=A0A6J0C9G5_NEOLC|nr:uncharacterized protein LOC107226808 [Neodiprion lecontei]